MSAAPPSDAAPVALVTGATGFTGRHLCDALRHAGYRVIGTSHATADEAANGPHGTGDLHRVDLCSADQVQALVRQAQPTVVAHLAAVSFVPHGDVDAMYRVNIVGARHLLQALAQLPRPPRRVVLASSANIYGNASATGLLDEDTPAAPVNDYAVSKLAMEHMACLWMAQLPLVLARPFNYTGVGQSTRFVLPKIVAHFQRRADCIELGNLDVARDFSDVRTVAQAYVRLLETPGVEGRALNICSGQAWSLQQVLREMQDLTGHAMQVRINPAFVRAHEVRHLVGNPARLRQAIGPLPSISLPQTLRWMHEAGNFA
ncbi:MAG: GDP-mannose 4,6-dehydratase [Pseudomonadota bacterium]|nr:GDP-mannose 4,6-dehydratase [Pseudomonadota bacterium]